MMRVLKEYTTFKVSRKGNLYKQKSANRRHTLARLYGDFDNRRAYWIFDKSKGSAKHVRLGRKARIKEINTIGPYLCINTVLKARFKATEPFDMNDRSSWPVPIFIDFVYVRMKGHLIPLGWKAYGIFVNSLVALSDQILEAEIEVDSGYGILKDFTLDELSLEFLHECLPMKGLTPKRLASQITCIEELGIITDKGCSIESYTLQSIEISYPRSNGIFLSRKVIEQYNASKSWLADL